MLRGKAAALSSTAALSYFLVVLFALRVFVDGQSAPIQGLEWADSSQFPLNCLRLTLGFYPTI